MSILPRHRHKLPLSKRPFFRRYHSVLILIPLTFLIAFFLSPRKKPLTLHTLRPLPEETTPHKCTSTRPLYVFLHLHKTAGNALKHTLFAFANKNHLNLYHTCHPPRPDSAFTAWWFNRHKQIHDGTDCNLEALAKMHVAEREKIDIIMGHQYLGVHTLFPNRETRYFTFLRHPVARKISHYNHFEPTNRSATQHYMYLVQRNNNYMTKRLATNHYITEFSADIRARFIDLDPFALRAALRAAKKNILNRFFFVGLQERYSQSLCILSEIFQHACTQRGTLLTNIHPLNAKNATKYHENVRNATHTTMHHLPPSIRHATAVAEDADMQLYSFAISLYQTRLSQYPQCAT